MPETATEERPNSVTIEDAGPSRKRLKIEVPAESVDEKLNESLDTLSVEAQMPGFRKGRAPKQLVRRRFGEAVRNEVKEQLIASAYSQAVDDHKLKVVGDPIAEHISEVQVEPGKPLAFDVEVEVVPEFELPPLEGIEVLEPQLEVTDELVAQEIEKIRINEGELQEREESEPGDYLTGHGVMTGGDGTVHYDIQGAVVQVPTPDREGRGMILGVMVEDFAKQMGAPKPGESFTIKTSGPENHEVEKIRGDDLTITFEVERVDRIIPAELADLLGRFGMESEDQLRDALRSRLEQRVAIEQQNAMRQQVARHLLETTPVDLPERLSAQQAVRTLERRRMDLMYRGVPAEDIEQHMAELRAASQEAAQRELKMFFILHQAAEQLDVKVSEAEINGRITQLAIEQGERPDKLRTELLNRNQIGAIYQQVREHKTMDAILSKAKVEQVSKEEFEKRMNASG